MSEARGQETPPGCSFSGAGAAITRSPSGPVNHGDKICYTVQYNNGTVNVNCELRNFDADLFLADGSVIPLLDNATIASGGSVICPSADPRCLTASNCTIPGQVGYEYIVDHTDEVANFNACPPTFTPGTGRIVAHTYGEGDSLTLQGDFANACATANNIVPHGSCCEPCTGTCTDDGTCNECPGGSVFTLDGDCGTSCLLTCGDADACTTDGVCIPGSGRDNCAATPGGTPATCSPDIHFCDVPPPDFTCDDANVCTTDICLDDADPNNPCCANEPIVCPPVPCMRITGCDPITGCQYTFDCREPGETCCPDDGNPCTAEFCDAATGLCGAAPQCTIDAECDDLDVCTADSCVDSCCINEDIPCPVVPCFRSTGCDPITGCIYVPDCRTGPLGTCCPDDANACTEEFCDAGTGICGATPDCTTEADCNDNDVCTTNACVDSCCEYTPIVCPALPCQRNVGCDPILGCQYVFDCREPAAPGEVCCPDDGNPCTAEFCDAATGACGATPDCTSPADCNDQNLCTVDTCVNSCCEHTPFVCPEIPCRRLTGCDPTTGCQYVDDCRTGPLDTCCPDDGNPCTAAFCDAVTGICGSTPDCTTDVDCDDQNICTTDSCLGSCCENTPIFCEERECFTLVGCDPIAGCTYEPVFPCCGDGIVTPPETCDPPGSVTPEGLICTDICRFCGDGNLDPGEECEVGIDCSALDKPCKNTICNDQCLCVKDPEPDGTIISSDEFCMDWRCEDGVAYPHPKPAGVSCGNPAPEGVCDTPDTCDGFGHCASNYKEPGTICRPAVNVCDVAEPCSGLSPDCPPNTFAASGTPAPDDGLECTWDVCDGQGNIVHPPKPWGTQCGNQSTGLCDLPDRCDGAGVCDMNLIVGGANCRLGRMAKFEECMMGPNVPYPDPSCFTVDMDQDGDVDHEDCSRMMD